MPSVTQKLAAANEALAAANARIAALEAWISGAIEVYCNQRALITELESQLAAPVAPQRSHYRVTEPEPE